MSSAPTPEEIARDATWLAQALDPVTGVIRMVAMNEDSYRTASFLDDRLLQQTVDAQVMPWPKAEAAVAGDLRRDARWIFHIGHVGSTLVSRLLGELPGVLGVREPRLLRDLALSPPEVRAAYIGPTPKLMSRTFAEDQLACVKATSFASEIAPDLVPPGERALFMYATPANYVASILAGPNSITELRMLADMRGQRLQERGIAFPEARNEADLAAMAWTYGMTTIEGAADRMEDRYIAWADFDSMLDDLTPALGRITHFFGFRAEPGELRAIAEGPLTRRYSKALEYEYGADLRRNLLGEATMRFRKDIDAALAMIRSVAEKSPLLARALSRAES